MTVRVALLLSFIAGSLFGAAALWAFGELTTGRSRAATSTPPLVCPEPATAGSTLCSEDLARTALELARERETVARLRDVLDRSAVPASKPPPETRRARRRRDRAFDEDLLASIGFEPDEIAWIRERWERAESELRDIAAVEGRGESPPPGASDADIDRELREDLGADGYDAMLYATHQNNRVRLERVRDGSVAKRAGLAAGSVVWSYDGERIFRPKELAMLSNAGNPNDAVEIVIVTPDGNERFFVERRPLGAELVGTVARPNPN